MAAYCSIFPVYLGRRTSAGMQISMIRSQRRPVPSLLDEGGGVVFVKEWAFLDIAM